MNRDTAIPVEEVEERFARQQRFRPFPKYRDSGIEWLGELPAHWVPCRLKFVARTITGNTPPKGDAVNYDSGGIPWVKPDDLGQFTPVMESKECLSAIGEALARPVPKNSSLVCCIGSVGKLGVAGCRLATNQQINSVVFRATSVHWRFGQYALYASKQEHIRWSNLNVVAILNADSQRNISLALPSLDEQRAIAAFLDRKMARIDELIAKKQRLIELLAEKRTAFISHAVTKGLNPNAPMKDSGIDWLGEMPSAWTVHQLRRVVRRFVDYRGRTPTKTDSGVPLITAGAVRDGAIDHSRAPEYMAEYDYQDWMCRGWPEKNDIVITTEAPLAEVALVENVDIALAQRIILFKLNRSRVYPEWIRYYYLSTAGRSELLSRASGSTAPGIRADRLRMSRVLVPPLQEQRTIIEYLNPRVAELVAPIDSIQSDIATLSEYCSALISAAVTGKIDVREISK